MPARPARGAAEVNAGWIVPAESAPVPGPGMISKSLKWMLRRDSPLYIRPVPRPGLRQVHARHVAQLHRVRAAGRFRGATCGSPHGTIEAYEDYRADGIDFELRTTGC